MDDEMKQFAVHEAEKALDASSSEKLVASYMKSEPSTFKERYKSIWHCIAGRYFGGYTVGYSWFEGNLQGGEWRDAYERVLPERFDLDAGAQADSFTRHMIKDYTVEGQDKDTGIA